ncbi:MAG: hypothetical protein KGL53_01035, partial [Elusimicrobia bacterium]|nr:hypothetical protein [Elusimicrobiota bacterium]
TSARNPKSAEALFDWASALLRAGAAEEAGEPLARLRERFPRGGLLRRRLEDERLRLLGDAGARRSALLEDLALYPWDPGFLTALSGLDLSSGRWTDAEAEALAVTTSPPYGAQRADLLFQARDQGGWHAGPYWEWTQSPGSRSWAVGAQLRAVPARGWKLSAEGDRAGFSVVSSGRRGALAGASVSASRVRPDWEGGGDLDARGGSAAAAVSPGLSAAWHPRGRPWSATGQASVGRLWTASPEAAAAGVKRDVLDLDGTLRPLPLLALELRATYNRLSAAAGGRASQEVESPNVMLTLLQTPLSLGVGYRFFAEDTSGDAAFFNSLPLVRRARTHYLTASAGRSWLAGRLQADSYLFDGADPGRGLRFGSDLFGFGVSLRAVVERLTLAASFDQAIEDQAGVGQRSRSARLSAAWRFGAGPYAAPEGVR